ncbi:MAG: hypothetical protein ACOCYC_00830 [bacterium]
MASILIAGVPRSGKSTIARKVAEATGATYFPVDALVSTLGSLYPELGITHFTDDPGGVSTHLAPVLVELQGHLHYERMAVVLDAYQCFPNDLVAALKHRHLPPPNAGDAPFGVAYVGYPHADVKSKSEEIRTHARADDWSQSLDDAALEKLVERYIRESREISAQCVELGWSFTDTSADFDTRVSAAVERISATLS